MKDESNIHSQAVTAKENSLRNKGWRRLNIQTGLQVETVSKLQQPSLPLLYYQRQPPVIFHQYELKNAPDKPIHEIVKPVAPLEVVKGIDLRTYL